MNLNRQWSKKDNYVFIKRVNNNIYGDIDLY